MAERSVIHPLIRGTRAVRIDLETEGQKVIAARVGTTSYWDFSRSLTGRDPLDALQVAQRWSGVDFTAHVVASARAIEKAAKVSLTKNTRLLRNILLALGMIYGHINHFYKTALPDYIPYPVNGPFLGGQGDFRISPVKRESLLNNTWRAYQICQSIHHAMALLGGKAPHICSVVFGGSTTVPDRSVILKLGSLTGEIARFINSEYKSDIIQIETAYPDYYTLGGSGAGLLAVGEYHTGKPESLLFPGGTIMDSKKEAFDEGRISFDLTGSFYELLPGSEKLVNAAFRAAPQKSGGYSWIKGAVYNNKTFEVGALARMKIKGLPVIKAMGSRAASVMGRLRARFEEAAALAGLLPEWIADLKPGVEAVMVKPPRQGEGVGMAEGSEGPVIHYLSIKDGVIENYNMLDAASWNLCPGIQDGGGGPLEESLAGAATDGGKFTGILRIARSF